MTKRGISEEEYKAAAKILGCDVKAIKAVTIVESSKNYPDGFLPSGEPVVLFEKHIFRKYTGGKFDKSHPKLSSYVPSYKDSSYGPYSIQHAKLAEAVELDRKAALMSCSWGMFQIMGFNYTVCDFSHIQDFVNAMYDSSGEHLKAFCKYIINTGLDDELRGHLWTPFARKYNGPDYKSTHYPEKLAAVYEDL